MHAFFGCIAYVREGSRSLSGKPVEFWKFREGRLARRFASSVCRNIRQTRTMPILAPRLPPRVRAAWGSFGHEGGGD